MSYTIDNEVRQRIRIPLDLDFMANRYQTSNGIYTFTSPSMWTIEKNLFYLLKHSVEVDLDQKYIRKPWLLAYDQYQLVTLEYLIMYVNGVPSPEEFDISSVVLPSMDAIVRICDDKFSKKDNVNSLEKIEW